MNVIAWMLFGIINGLALYMFEGRKDRVSAVSAMALGSLGALSGGTFAFLLFGGISNGFNATLLLVIFFEAVLLFLLLSKKSFKRI